jgi:V/A-type H+/Na+-transporting ATPase subunit D
MWLRRRLATATRGVELLERELAALRILHDDARARLERTAVDWARTAAAAGDTQLRAELAAGPRGIRVGTPAPAATVEITWTTAMGVRYPSGAACTVPPPGGTAVDGSAAVPAARAAHVEALRAAARHAAAVAAEGLLAAQVATTRQRVRALRRRWVPRLTDALRLREIELDEQERASRRRGDFGRVPEDFRPDAPRST